MATTALFVEILVIGALAEVWIGAIIIRLAGNINLSNIATATSALGPLTTLLAVPLLALTYALGWIMNFVSERLFKPFFQTRERDKFFDGKAANYDEARALIFSKGSHELINEIHFDRHIIRIARSNVVNFTLLAVALLLYLSSSNLKVILLCILFSILLASISFVQWLTRYRSQYKRIREMARELAAR